MIGYGFMTKVFIADVSELKSIDLYKNCVSEYRYIKVEKINNVQQQFLSIGAELLLYDYLGRVPEYKIDEYSKPYGEEVEFNFSHSGNIAVCAVSEYPVGVDVEKIRNVNFDVAKRNFSKKEYEKFLNSQNPEETFFEIWVKKESYAKALGTGLRSKLSDIDTESVTDWQFYIYYIYGYKVCVCAKEKPEFIIKNLS